MRFSNDAYRLVFAAACVLFAGTGCDKIKEKIAEKAAEKMIESQSGEKVDIDTSGGKVTIQGKDGKGTVTFGTDTKLPDDFPKSVPVYPGAKVQSVLKSESGKGESGVIVTLVTTDQADKVGTFYKDAAGKGKKQLLDMQTPAGRMVSWQTADDRQASIVASNVTDGTGGTQIVMTVGKAK